MLKRIFSFLLALAMLIGMLPMMATEAEAVVTDYLWPIRGGYTMSRAYCADIGHYGLDIKAGEGTPVLATKPGTVVGSSNSCSHINLGKLDSDREYCNGGRGNYVKIEHDDGTYSQYMHLLKGSAIAKGTKVKQGDVIGKVSSTGRSEGYHLHFEIFNTSNKKIDCNPVNTDGRFEVWNKSTYKTQKITYIFEVTHTYSGNGVCSKCGYQFPIVLTPGEAGTCKVLKDFIPRTDGPYDAAAKDTVTIKANTQVTVLGSVKNAYGNKWYKIVYGSGKTGYVYHDRISFVSNCIHEYAGAGVCSACQYPYPTVVNTSDSGTYKVLTDFVPRTDRPYDAATKGSATIKANTQVAVLGSLINAYGNKWYQISYGDGKTGFVYHDRVSFLSSCIHNYSGAGVCTKCKYQYPITVNVMDSGIYKVLKDFVPRTNAPYDAATADSVTIKANTRIDVMGSVINAYGNKWYKISYGSGKTGYVYHDRLSFVEIGAQEITCTITSPKEGATVPRKAYSLVGTVTSKYPLKKVEAYIDGKLYATVSLGSQYSLTLKSSAIDSKLKFADLAPGAHTLVLKAHDIHRSAVIEIITRNFVSEGAYAVVYNANGGTGAPASQTKTPGKVLTLSTTVPTRDGYTFLGWATSATATSATYQPGGSFTTDANTTLYAVWKVSGPSITTQPKSTYVKTGVNTKFTVAATGAGLTYQWQYRTSSTGTWKATTLSGAKTATLTVPGAVSRNGYQYRCVITDANGNTVTSNAATLTVFGIKTQPASVTANVGATTTFKVAAIGNGLTYQWQWRKNSSSTWATTTVSGNKTATISVPATAARNGYQYRCKITDTNGNVVYSNAATLTVKSGPSITTQPKSTYVKTGVNTSLTVKATGTGLTYQWQYRTSSSGTWYATTLTGAKTATLTIPGAVSRNGYQYRCVITDANGNKVTSNAATLTVFGIKTQPASVTANMGATTTFKVAAIGNGLTYQWQWRKNASSTWANTTVSGNKTATITVPATAARNGYQYRCKITDTNGNVIYSSAATLTVK